MEKIRLCNYDANYWHTDWNMHTFATFIDADWENAIQIADTWVSEINIDYGVQLGQILKG